jgi:hypothetical protein
VRTRYGPAVALVAALALVACHEPHCPPLPKGPHIAVRHSRRITVGFENGYAEVHFNSQRWVWESQGPAIPVPLYGQTPSVTLLGRMSLWTREVAVFRSDDGRTFTFGPRGVGCA